MQDREGEGGDDGGFKAGKTGVQHSLGRSRARALGQVSEVVTMADRLVPS